MRLWDTIVTSLPRSTTFGFADGDQILFGWDLHFVAIGKFTF